MYVCTCQSPVAKYQVRESDLGDSYICILISRWFCWSKHISQRIYHWIFFHIIVHLLDTYTWWIKYGISLYTVKVPFEAPLLIEAAVGLEGHSPVECVYIKSNKVSDWVRTPCLKILTATWIHGRQVIEGRPDILFTRQCPKNII